MATHDYDIANQSGAAFRTDLNNALAAIQSNNSNSSSPATTVAYQWWADTTNGVLKIRNSSNNDWVELLQLDGTLTLEDGSASTPGLAFRDDLNTGIFSSAADTFNVATAGTERMRIDSSGNVGIGTSPSSELHVKGSGEILRLETTATTGSNYINFNDADENKAFLGLGSGADDSFSISLLSNASLKFATNSTERMRIDSSGNVGIGTTSPAAELHVVESGTGTGTGGITSETASGGGNAGYGFRTNGTNRYSITLIGSAGSESLRFNDDQNSAERMRITNAGHLCYNCTSLPSSSVQGVGIEKKTSQTILFISAGNTTSASNLAEFFNSNGQVGRIVVSGSATAYNTSSDYRLKENATAISDGITRLKTLKPYRFNFIADASTTVDGFFAHEVTAVPEAITGTKDEVDSDNNPVYQGIDQSKLVPLLVAAVQELITKVETLETA